ncbi:hypothetical protein CDAR_567771 [Caerostris darwini]|uniref:Uncharacterized protein n=1 Tax=Caerostris darwini TaxID=1538125 RepID=A0AAV4RSZ2_9ARAC|nr:hypothetical protein CDAR_567771 [Caerostris darwini]
MMSQKENGRRQGGAAVRYQDGESSPTGGGHICLVTTGDVDSYIKRLHSLQVCRQLADVPSTHANYYRYELWEKLAKKPRICLRLLGPWEGGRWNTLICLFYLG